MAEKQRKFYQISSWVPDPPTTRDAGLEACSGVVPFNGGMLVVSGRKTILSNIGSPLLDEAGDILTDEDGIVLNAENFTNSPNNSLHVHYARGMDNTVAAKVKYYFNIADLFVGQWDAIYKVSDVLDQMGAQDILDVTNQTAGTFPYGDGGAGGLNLDPVPWSFASFGWNKVIATNYSDPIQRYVYGTANDYFQEFLSGGATSIRAKFVCTIGQHVLLGNIVVDGTDATTYFGGASDTFHPQLVWWSGTDNETLFSDEGLNPEANTGYQWLLSTPGPITAMKSVGENEVVIFKPHGIELMSLTGGDALFSFQTISTTIGTLSPQSVVVVGRDVYFVDSSGKFQVIRNLTSVERIGAGAVDTLASNTYVQAALAALGKTYTIGLNGSAIDGSKVIGLLMEDDINGAISTDGAAPIGGGTPEPLNLYLDSLQIDQFPNSRSVAFPLRSIAGAYSYHSSSVVWSVRPIVAVMTQYGSGESVAIPRLYAPLMFVIYSTGTNAFSCILDVNELSDLNSPFSVDDNLDTVGTYGILVPVASYTSYEGADFPLEESGVLYSVRRTVDQDSGLTERYDIDDIWGGGRGEWASGVYLSTKRFSLSDSPIMPVPGRIHAVRIVTDIGQDTVVPVDYSQFGIFDLILQIRSYDGRGDCPVHKTFGADENSNGWFTVPHGGIAGYQFQIVLRGTRPAENGPHILGFDIQYSLGGERA